MKKETTETIIPVTPKKIEESTSVNYLKYLSNMIEERKENEGKLFYNEGKPFASLLMATLLKNTHTSLKMYCTGLRPGILCGKDEGDGKGYEGAYWEAFKEFFTTSNIKNYSKNAIQILVQTDKWKENLPFRRVFECQKEYPEQVSVRIIKRSSIRYLFGLLNDTVRLGKNNFAIFDGTAYRMEYNPDRFLAKGSFNDPKTCSFLSDLFDEEFCKSEIVINPLLVTK